MGNEQFTNETIGRYIDEHDSVGNSLRMSLSGGQLCMDEREVHTLLSLLQHRYLYEDSVRYETD